VLADLSGATRVWAVVAVRSRKERQVEEALFRVGLDCYCPRLGSRRSGTSVRPLFPGYCFVYCSPRLEFSTMTRQPGVLRALLFNGQLACVEPELVEGWKKRECGRGFLVPEAPPPFRRGQKVRVVEGVFMGLDATVLEVLPSRERVRLLLQHLGGSLQVEVDRTLLR
jgi:transcription antitermination factor NusG